MMTTTIKKRTQKHNIRRFDVLRCYLLKCVYFIFECDASKNTWTVIEFLWMKHTCPKQIAFDQHFFYISIRSVHEMCMPDMVLAYRIHSLSLCVSLFASYCFHFDFVLKQFPYIKYESHSSPLTPVRTQNSSTSKLGFFPPQRLKMWTKLILCCAGDGQNGKERCNERESAERLHLVWCLLKFN